MMWVGAKPGGAWLVPPKSRLGAPHQEFGVVFEPTLFDPDHILPPCNCLASALTLCAPTLSFHPVHSLQMQPVLTLLLALPLALAAHKPGVNHRELAKRAAGDLEKRGSAKWTFYSTGLSVLAFLQLCCLLICLSEVLAADIIRTRTS